MTFADFVSGIRPPDCSKSAKIQKNYNNVTIFRHGVIINFCWHCFVSRVKFSYWFKFNVNIIPSSGIMTISFYKGLTRNPEIGNSSSWVLPNIWRLGRVMDTKFGTKVSNRILLNAAKCQGLQLLLFLGTPLLRENQLGGDKITSPSLHTQIRVKRKKDYSRIWLC